MRTLEYKKEIKQKENALETIEIFVPLAYYIGAYRIKSELEDLSLKYLKPDLYKRIEDKKIIVEEESKPSLNEMVNNISNTLEDKNHGIKVRTKNIYGIYKRLEEGNKISDIHDLLALKIMVDEIDDCYITLRKVHELYHPINSRFKDYICNPKTNLYQSLHTTVFGPEERLVQTQIRTFDMDKVASFGLTSYWDINKGEARNVMQKDLREKSQFFNSLKDINKSFLDNKEFVSKIKKELLSNNIYVYNMNGEVIELPLGSTPVDLAYKMGPDYGNTLVAAVVNGEYVSLDYPLSNKDIVKIITDDLAFGPKDNLLDIANTSTARKKIKDFNGR